jgi:hypothetical protein
VLSGQLFPWPRSFKFPGMLVAGKEVVKVAGLALKKYRPLQPFFFLILFISFTYYTVVWLIWVFFFIETYSYRYDYTWYFWRRSDPNPRRTKFGLIF